MDRRAIHTLKMLAGKPAFLYGCLFIISAAVFVLYRPFEQPVAGDPAIYDYIGQSILRGQIPYRDVVDIKGPGSYYITAGAMWIGKAFGLRDVLADRLVHGLMLALLVGAVFQVANDYLENIAAGVIASLFVLMSSGFVYWASLGGQPKLPMILFGVLAMLMIRRDHSFWAGLFSMLSCLCWQPGLLFGGTAFLLMSRYLTRWRDMRAVKVAAGAALPALVAVLWLSHLGALRYFWSYAFEYNYSVFGPRAARPISLAVLRLWRVSLRIFGPLMILVALSAGGWCIYVVKSVRAKLAARSLAPPDWRRDAIAIPPLTYFMFCLINFQNGPDLILFFPFIGIFASYFIVKILKQAGRWRPVFRFGPAWVPPITGAFMLLVAFQQGVVTWRSGKGFFKAQDRRMKSIGALLGPNDEVYVHGSVELLVMLNRPNLNSYIFMDWGMDDFIAAKWYGGSFQRVIGEMERQAPALVMLSRLGAVTHGSDLEQWATEHYDRQTVAGETVFRRKPQQETRGQPHAGRVACPCLPNKT